MWQKHPTRFNNFADSESLDSTYLGPFLTFVFCMKQMWRLSKNLVLEYEAAYQMNDGHHSVIQGQDKGFNCRNDRFRRIVVLESKYIKNIVFM
jgi:hypothetical protein